MARVKVWDGIEQLWKPTGFVDPSPPYLLKHTPRTLPNPQTIFVPGTSPANAVTVNVALSTTRDYTIKPRGSVGQPQRTPPQCIRGSRLQGGRNVHIIGGANRHAVD